MSTSSELGDIIKVAAAAAGGKFMNVEEDMQVAKLNFVKDGATKLPPGFRFQPTDQEIVFQYLLRKTISCPLPATIIPEFFNLSLYHPRDLPGDLEQDRYFFSKKLIDDNANGNRGGYWKATGVEKRISRTTIRCHDNFSSSNSIIRREIAIMGMKKTLVFYNAAGRTTLWIMHEYRLLHSLINPGPSKNSQQKSWVPMGDWVLCHIFLKKGSRAAHRDYEDQILATNNVRLAQQKRLSCDFMISSTDDCEVICSSTSNFTSSSCSSSSSSSFLDSSVTTEVSSNGIN